MKSKRAASSTFWRLFSYFKPRRFQYLASLLIVASIFAGERIFTGWIVLLFSDAIANQNLQELGRAVLYWGLFALGMMIFSPIFLYSWRSAIVHGIANLRQAVFNHLQRLPLGYYESRHSGEAMSVLTNDVSTSEQAFQQVLIDLFQNTFQGIGAILFMLFLKWDLALIIILGGIVPLIVNSVAAPRLRKIGHETQDSLAILSERLSDLLAGFQVIRSFNLGDWILNRFYEKSQDVLNVNLKRVRIESGLASANELGSIASLVSYAVGAYMVLDGQVSLGVLFGMIQLNNAVSNFFYSLGSTISRLQASLAAGDRLLAVLDTPAEPEKLPAAPPVSAALPAVLTPELQATEPRASSLERAFITFEKVAFSYSESQPILRGISFEILPGQIAALVGPSGSGKSTIFRLLMGHYPASQGLITCQGQPIHSLSLADWRQRFAFVPQDAYLYDGTIQENIRYGKPDASDDEVIEAARASYAHEFILEQPEGYQTRVGERGAHLSGGQRQRIAIARALIKDTPVLLLDEATSALDSESEEIVQEALKVLMKNRTTLAIAHRLSTIEHADVIYVLDQGQIVQRGSHRELVLVEGMYRYLYDLQYAKG